MVKDAIGEKRRAEKGKRVQDSIEIINRRHRTRWMRAHYDLSLIKLLHRAEIAPAGVMTEDDVEQAARNLRLPQSWDR